MKSILLLSALFLAVYFEVATGQEEYDRRFEQFLNDSLAGFPKWLKENGFSPYPLDRDGSFAVKSEDAEKGQAFDYTGKVWNRFYHGIEKGIEAPEIQSNLSYSTFYIVLDHGDTENSFVEGQYYLDGTAYLDYPFHGEGKFTRTNLLEKIRDRTYCWFEVTDDGYFQLKAGVVFMNTKTTFQNFTLYGLDYGAVEVNVAPVVESWYKSQFRPHERPSVAGHWMDYMAEILAVTPIADIVGDKFTPTVTSSAKGLRKVPKYSSSEPFFDKEKKEWRQNISFSYENN